MSNDEFREWFMAGAAPDSPYTWKCQQLLHEHQLMREVLELIGEDLVTDASYLAGAAREALIKVSK